MKNIFIEGTQGSGKTTLLRLLSQKLPEYHMYWEGDISPVELAWCTYMTQEQYEQAMLKFPDQEREILQNTEAEGEHRIVSYTRIMAENRAFYEYMEQFEIYNGRKTFAEFKEIILRRYGAFRGTGNLFECSFFQNIIETLMLHYQFSEDEIVDFYREAYEKLEQENFLMLYLDSAKENMEENIERIRRERTDLQGKEIWYELMMRYLNESPYGKEHPFEKTADMAAHFQRRRVLEKRIIQDVIGENCIVLPAKTYDLDDVVAEILKRNAESLQKMWQRQGGWR